MLIGIYPTKIENSGLGGDAWQCFEVDPNDPDAGRILAYFHHDTPREKVEAALRAMHPDCSFDWIM